MNRKSGEQAADALRPLAGEFAFVLFAAGIIGTGLLAVPILAGSAAYAAAETLRWPIMVILMLLAANPRVMGSFVARRRLKWLGWLATAVMGIAVAAMLLLF